MADEGMNHLARVLHGRMRANSDADSSLILNFGVIQSDYSLLTNTYPIPIPKTDYLVLRQLTLGNTGAYLTQTGHHTPGDRQRIGGCRMATTDAKKGAGATKGTKAKKDITTTKSAPKKPRKAPKPKPEMPENIWEMLPEENCKGKMKFAQNRKIETEIRSNQFVNIKLILKKYRLLKQQTRCTKNILAGFNNANLDLETGQSIKVYQQKTMTILCYIDRLLGYYKSVVEQSGKPDIKRRYRVIMALYVDDEKKTISQIMTEEQLKSRAVYNDINKAVIDLKNITQRRTALK